MKKNKANYFATREKAQSIEKALNVLSEKQMITINGGFEQFEEDLEDSSDYKNYAESTSYSRKTTYAKLRSPK
ncbi:hypothetical protein [uncultured Chryseobacterium sp.]|uniref:hypothetical protein n=1 Tax=uncultured Chryseobacterium sp. TaxID=259322 RepID=UPI0025EFE25E|nr:hypothetical protein [uncultured Chryseobacterium sp.]